MLWKGNIHNTTMRKIILKILSLHKNKNQVWRNIIENNMWNMREQIKHTGNQSISSNIWIIGALENMG